MAIKYSLNTNDIIVTILLWFDIKLNSKLKIVIILMFFVVLYLFNYTKLNVEDKTFKMIDYDDKKVNY